MYHILILVLVAQVQAIVKTRQVVHLEDVCILLCENYSSIKNHVCLSPGLTKSPAHCVQGFSESSIHCFSTVVHNTTPMFRYNLQTCLCDLIWNSAIPLSPSSVVSLYLAECMLARSPALSVLEVLRYPEESNNFLPQHLSISESTGSR